MRDAATWRFVALVFKTQTFPKRDHFRNENRLAPDQIIRCFAGTALYVLPIALSLAGALASRIFEPGRRLQPIRGGIHQGVPLPVR